MSISLPITGAETSPGLLLNMSGHGAELSLQNSLKWSATFEGKIEMLVCKYPAQAPYVCCLKYFPSRNNFLKAPG